MNYGVGLFPTEPLPKMIRLAKLSERLGFSHIWVGDSHLIWREAYVNMAATALNTRKVKIGTGVTNPLTRHPSVLASAYATLEELSPRRFIVGIGLGDSSVETMGLKPARLAYFEKTIAQMRALLAGEEVEIESGAGGWTFRATLEHADTGWDDYADGWRVETSDGTILGERPLLHPHVDEQPFTRSLAGVTIPEGIAEVVIRARTSVEGWSEHTSAPVAISR